MTSLWQHRATKMTNVTQTITGQFFNGCKHRARQKTSSSVCVNGAITTRGMGTAPFNQLPWLSSAALPGAPGFVSRQEEQAGPDGPGCCLRPQPHGQRVLLVLCCTQHSSSLFEPQRAQRPACSGSRDSPAWGLSSHLSLFRKTCYSNGIPCQAWYSLNVPHWLQMWPSLTRLCAQSSTGTAHCIFNLI